MIALSVGQIAQAVDGSLVAVEPDRPVTSVVTDSRGAASGSIFVAIAGDRVDGHDFARDAIAAGGSVVLSSRPLADDAGSPLPCIVVDSPVEALGQLGAWYRRDLLDCTVVAITGSSGKTSTKDLVASILATIGPTVSPQGSFNTEVGVPLTILEADESTRFLVLEMGMRGPGHIAYLAGLASPDVGAVINVGSAHLGMLGSRSAIADAKAELVDALPNSGVAVLSADDAVVMAMAARTLASVVSFGEAAEAGVRVTDIVLDDRARPSFTLVDQRRDPTRSLSVSLRLSGRHQAINAAAAAAICLSAGASLEQVASALTQSGMRSRWRMEIVETPGGAIVVNDAYNANPDSMRAALASLAAMTAVGRKWAVLGEMRELGDASAAEHEAIARLAVDLGIDRLVSVGEGTIPMHEAAMRARGFEDRAVYVPDVDAALELLRREVQAGDLLLIKASRSIGLERVALGLTGRDAP